MKDYKGRLRVRSCGLIVKDHSLLLAKIDTPARNHPVWMPPGGEVEPGETLAEGVIREIHEETGLNVEPERISMVHEFIETPYYAVEFFFTCRIKGGDLKLGTDPEMEDRAQILLDLKYIPFTELQNWQVYPQILKSQIHQLVLSSGEIIHVSGQ